MPGVAGPLCQRPPLHKPRHVSFLLPGNTSGSNQSGQRIVQLTGNCWCRHLFYLPSMSLCLVVILQLTHPVGC